MLKSLGCLNKTCEHRWYCKNYEFIVDSELNDYIDISESCIIHNYCLLDANEDMKTLYEAGRDLNKMFNITHEKIDEAINGIRESK